MVHHLNCFNHNVLLTIGTFQAEEYATESVTSFHMSDGCKEIEVCKKN
jgi:hypothetical protein